MYDEQHSAPSTSGYRSSEENVETNQETGEIAGPETDERSYETSEPTQATEENAAADATPTAADTARYGAEPATVASTSHADGTVTLTNPSVEDAPVRYPGTFNADRTEYYAAPGDSFESIAQALWGNQGLAAKLQEANADITSDTIPVSSVVKVPSLDGFSL